jgi:UDP-glucose 4-epimerase
MKTKKIVVTGAGGYIASHLIDRLMENENYIILGIDKQYSVYPQNASNVSLSQINTVDIEKVADFDTDYIFHLGEYARVEQSFNNFEEVLTDNLAGTAAIINFWKKSNAKLIYAGSSTKFSDNGLGYTSSPYALTKAHNTELISNAAKWYELKYAITYFYNVYGGREQSYGDKATLIGIFRRQMYEKQPLSVRLPGSQQRNFTHINDIIEGICKVAFNGEGDGYGIGASETYSILEVANMFGGEIEYLKSRAGNRTNGLLLTDKTELLGWKQQVSLKQYISNLRENDWIDPIGSSKHI